MPRRRRVLNLVLLSRDYLLKYPCGISINRKLNDLSTYHNVQISKWSMPATARRAKEHSDAKLTISGETVAKDYGKWRNRTTGRRPLSRNGVVGRREGGIKLVRTR